MVFELSGRQSALLLAAGLLVMLLAQSAAAAGPAGSPGKGRRTVCIRSRCFSAEVAVTEAERARGLMHREALGADQAMLFVFPEESIHSFWMKNTKIPLDIIFIDGAGKIVSIAMNAQPCRKEPCDHYAPAGKAAYALEINGGLAAVYGFAPGDPVTFF